jgi:hypothetical protein
MRKNLKGPDGDRRACALKLAPYLNLKGDSRK